MERVLVFITQLQNLTHNTVGFRVPGQLYRIRDLPPNKTGIIKLYRILRYCRENGADWSVGVLVDGNYTGIELSSSHLLKCARIVFRYDENDKGENVLVVDGIREDPNSDYFFRLGYFGWMRNVFWDKRPIVKIDRWDSVVATKLRGIEETPVVAAKGPLFERQTPSPEAKKITQKKPVYYSPTVPENESNGHRPILSSDSGNTNGKKLEKNNVGETHPKSRDKFKTKANSDGKQNPHVNNNNALPPPQPTRNEERIPNNNILLDSPPDNYYMDDFVYGILFGFALVFVMFVRVWIG